MPKKVLKGTAASNGKKSKDGRPKTPRKAKEDNANEVMLKSIHKVDSHERIHNHHGTDLEKQAEAEEDHDVTSVTSRGGKGKRRTNRCMCVTISGLLLLIFCGAVVILVLLFLMVGERPPKVQTDCGFIEGDFDSATKSFSFKGIPYARPPVGVRRWHPPEPLQNGSCTDDTIKAVKTPPQCAQKDPNSGRISGDEDCLYLNIYTPKIDPLKLARVMVYIHGGYLQWGNASTKGYCPDEHTAVKMGLVFVNVQYRLNAFGFLVTDAQKGTGNYGLLDQIEALRWIKKNIRKFGGDPDEITIFGQSSGGTSVFALMTSPLAKGLFARAWMLSGSPVINKTLSEARAQNDFFLRKLNCNDEACLLRKSTDEILDAMYPNWGVVLDYSMDLPKRGFYEPALLIVDGKVLPVKPFDAWDQRNKTYYSDVPFIVGTTAQEVDLSPAPGDDLKKWDPDELYNYVLSHLKTFGDPLLANRSLDLYRIRSGDRFDAELLFTTMATDIRVTCGNNRLAAKAAEALTSQVYRYVVTSHPSRDAHALNMAFDAKFAFHGWDIYAFLDTHGSILDGSKSSSDERFSETLRDNIVSFVKTSMPKNKDWIGYPHAIALINDNLRTNKTYNEEQCQLWRNDEFFSYSWVN